MDCKRIATLKSSAKVNMSDKIINTKDLLHAIREIPATQLSAIEKHILTIILSCLNMHNETWYSFVHIARFACLSLRSIKRHVKILEQKKFIIISRPSYYASKITNYYQLNIELIMSFHVDNFKNVDKSGVTQSPVTTNGCHTVTRTGVTQSPERVSRWHSKKERKKETKRERGKSFPFPPDFFLSPQSIELIESCGLDEEEANEIINKFVDYYSGKHTLSDDWQRMLQIWIRRELDYRKERKEKKMVYEPEEKPWYHVETENMPRGNGMGSIVQILENCKSNRHGGQKNEMGRESKGKN